MSVLRISSWAFSEELVPPEKQLSENRLYELADAALSGLHNAPPIFVLDSPELLSRHSISVDGAPMSDRAIIDGKLFLFRDGIPDATSALTTVWHELFHCGLRNLMTP